MYLQQFIMVWKQIIMHLKQIIRGLKEITMHLKKLYRLWKTLYCIWNRLLRVSFILSCYSRIAPRQYAPTSQFQNFRKIIRSVRRVTSALIKCQSYILHSRLRRCSLPKKSTAPFRAVPVLMAVPVGPWAYALSSVLMFRLFT